MEQIQIDLADFGKPASAFRYGLVAIDSFSKYLSVIPIANKTSRETANALDHVLQQLGIPATVMTDEGGEFQASFKERLQYYDIEHVVTRTPPIFVERAIRTVKEGLELRMKALNTKSWHTLVKTAVDKYKYQTHSPNSATVVLNSLPLSLRYAVLPSTPIWYLFKHCTA